MLLQNARNEWMCSTGNAWDEFSVEGGNLIRIRGFGKSLKHYGGIPFFCQITSASQFPGNTGVNTNRLRTSISLVIASSSLGGAFSLVCPL